MILETIDRKGMMVSIYDSRYANRSEEDRINWTTSLAAVSRGKDESSNPEKRYKSLMTEAEGNRPSRPFEFLPIVVNISNGETDDMGIEDDRDVISLIKFSSFPREDIMCTNMRALINANAIYQNIPYNDKIDGFAAFRIRAPMFVWAQVVTHTQLSTESQSDRVAAENEYWLPEDIEERLSLLYDKNSNNELLEKAERDGNNLANDIHSGKIPTASDEFIEYMIACASQHDVQLLLKLLGYKREIYSRAPYYFKIKEFVITGWVIDDNAWPHFLRERNAYADDGGPKNWTQKETMDLAIMIRELLEKYHGLSAKDVLEGYNHDNS